MPLAPEGEDPDSHWQHRIRSARSPIHGLGCFALTTIHPGEYIGWYQGTLAHRRDSVPNSIQLAIDLFVNPPDAHPSPLWHVNHSSAPNARLEVVGTTAHLHAFRNIPRGEEILLDYRAMMFEEDWEMTVGAGEWVASIDRLPEGVREELLARGDVPRWISEAVAQRFLGRAVG